MAVRVDMSAQERLERAVDLDCSTKRREYLFRLPAWLESRLEASLADRRDLPVALLFTNLLLTTLPAAICVAITRSHFLGASFCICNYAVYLQRFLVALLHVTEHRRLFNKDTQAASWIIPYLLAPFFGLPCGMYKLHHKIMHHVEGNHAPLDSSSTEAYQRDLWVDFVKYWARHTFGAWVSVPFYAFQKGQLDLLAECLGGELLYIGAAMLVFRWNAVAAIWIIFVPFLLTSIAIMFGNWSQHIFVDPGQPTNAFRSTYNCIGCSDNSRTFNDGYHILHHLNSRTHWSELPERLLATVGQHAAEDALVFCGIGFFDVGLLVMTGRLDRLAEYVVPLSPRFEAMSKGEIVDLMRARLQRLPKADPANTLHRKLTRCTLRSVQ